MPLVTTKQMLLDAQSGKYAVGAFNVENMEMIMAVVNAASVLRSPVILQTTPSTVNYAGLDYFYSIAKVAAENSEVPIAIHLDHGNSFTLAMRALHAGYTSIMIDGSHLSFEDNIATTKTVVDVCDAMNIGVEAELGKIGGKEDNLDGGSGNCTDPLEAQQFVERTGATTLAIAIGTAHGVYKGEPKVDIERLRQIKEVVSIPLVLHGTSGVADTIVQECIKHGICKVNYATDLRIIFTKALREALGNDLSMIDPKKYNVVGKEAVMKYVMERIKILGSENKA